MAWRWLNLQRLVVDKSKDSDETTNQKLKSRKVSRTGGGAGSVEGTGENAAGCGHQNKWLHNKECLCPLFCFGLKSLSPGLAVDTLERIESLVAFL